MWNNPLFAMEMLRTLRTGSEREAEAARVVRSAGPRPEHRSLVGRIFAPRRPARRAPVATEPCADALDGLPINCSTA